MFESADEAAFLKEQQDRLLKGGIPSSRLIEPIASVDAQERSDSFTFSSGSSPLFDVSSVAGSSEKTFITSAPKGPPSID